MSTVVPNLILFALIGVWLYGWIFYSFAARARRAGAAVEGALGAGRDGHTARGAPPLDSLATILPA
jgi:hypothetical protein